VQGNGTGVGACAHCDVVQEGRLGVPLLILNLCTEGSEWLAS